MIEKRSIHTKVRTICLLLGLIIVIVFGNGYICAKPNYVPLDRDSMVLLLRNTVANNLIPYTIETDNMVVTITRLNSFTMDWDSNQFNVECEFDAKYHKLITTETTGRASLSGEGLMCVPEQKIGVRFKSINELKLDKAYGLLNGIVRMALNHSLTGKELWYGPTPKSSEILTQDKLNLFLRVALANYLPLSGSNDTGTFTLNRVDELKLLPQPGEIQAKIQVSGEYRQVVKLAFSGQADVKAWAGVDPNQLAGCIRIEEVMDVKLDHSPDFLNGFVKMLVNQKIKGEEIHFSWK